MTLVNVVLSYRTGPVEVLERLVTPSAEVCDVLTRLSEVPAIDEVVVLSTCNRIEVYATTRGPVEGVTRPVLELMAVRGRIPVCEVVQMARIHVDAAAVEHVFAVACGLESMAVGEDQIVAQIKTCARTAAEAGTIGPVVTDLLDAALRVSKRARTQTRIGAAGISLARAGLDLAGAQLGGLASRRAVVLGTGATGRLAARLLREAGVGQLSVAGRSEASAAGVAVAVDGRPLLAGDVPAALADSDLLVTATGSAVPVVLAEQVRQARARVGDRPLVVVDLGMPPDVEAAVGRLAGVTLVDITALGRHLADRDVPDEIPRVRAIVAAEVVSYVDGQDGGAAGPVIGAMHAHVRQLADTELVRLQGRLPGLTEQQRDEMAATVHRIVGKCLHGPTLLVKQLSTDPGGAVYAAALRQLFDPTAREATP